MSNSYLANSWINGSQNCKLFKSSDLSMSSTHLKTKFLNTSTSNIAKTFGE
jgi:hypothetical protein